MVGRGQRIRKLQTEFLTVVDDLIAKSWSSEAELSTRLAILKTIGSNVNGDFISKAL